MRTWRASFKGMSVTVQLPSRRKGGNATPTGKFPAYQAVEAPKVQPPVRRNPQRAIDFLRAPELAGDGRSPNPAAQKFLAEKQAERDAISDPREKVALLPWYHTIDLGGGLVTPGGHDHREFVRHVGLPDDLTGLRVIDVATFDGFWAFELERRGAEVVAIDLPDSAQLDWPQGAREIVQAEQLDVPHGEGFNIAAEVLGSKVQRVPCSVYDLPTSGLGPFDLAFIGDVLLHLARPLDALRAVRSVCRDRLILVDTYDPEISGQGQTLIRYQGGWDGLQWWAPSLETLQQYVVDAGFEPPELKGTYQVKGFEDEWAGLHRAVLHSRITPSL